MKKLIHFCLLCVVSAQVWAASSSLPWESTLDTMKTSLTGPVATGVGVISLALCGAAWALGIGGAIVQVLVRIGFGLGLALNAASVITLFQH